MTSQIPPPASDTGLSVGYLINHYPKVSHTFIRREMLALERQGVTVHRFAMRGWTETVSDGEDRSEQARTRYLLRDGALPLLTSLARTALARPGAFLRALRQALQVASRNHRSPAVGLTYLAEACLLLRWCQDAGVPHLHAHFGTNPAAVAWLLRLLGGPSYSFTVHGPEEFDQPKALALGEKMEAAAFVVAISSFGRSQLMRWLRFDRWPSIHVVHCGLEPAFHAVDEQPADPLRLVCVGRICEQKGQLLLVRAVARLAARGIPFRLVLAGDGEMRPEVEALIAAHGLQAQVSITGWIDSARVRSEIQAARALVLPSFAEGLPVVLMEAMALRRPVVSTYIAGIPELVRPGQDGWLVPAGDVEALTETLAELLAAPESTLRRMGESARERVLSRHDIDTEAAKLRALLPRPR